MERLSASSPSGVAAGAPKGRSGNNPAGLDRVENPPVVHVERLALGGEGVAHLEGKVLFVPHALPGDDVEVLALETHTSWARVREQRLVKASALRRSPPCVHAQACGGCPWMGLDEQVQAETRRQVVVEVMQRLAGIPAELVLPTRRSPLELGYRSRLRLRAEGFRIGFRAAGSHTLVDIPTCVVAKPALNRLLAEVRAWLQPQLPLEQPLQLELQQDAEGGLEVGLLGEVLEQLRPFVASPGVKVVARPRVLEGGELVLRFAQAQVEQNQALVQAALQALAVQAEHRVLDLFCGSGNFSLPLLGRVKELVGVELAGPAVQEARRQAGKRATFLEGDCAEVVRGLIRQGQTFERVLLDPPRAGAREVCGVLPQLRPSRVVYVSCDPATLARDLKLLLQAGYELCSVEPFDMMPQTAHVECLAVLTRRGTR